MPTPKKRHRSSRWPRPSAPTRPARISEAVRLRLDIAYDGTDFAGWATQSGQRTVAGVLEDALTTILRSPIQVRAAGRTDAGVHARGQVAHIDVEPAALVHTQPRVSRADEPEFLAMVRRLSRLLPPEIRVLDIRRAPDGFDARFSALRRNYCYRLSTATFGVMPQSARYIAAWPRDLDLDAMQTASGYLLGLHDFAAFCRHREGATTIRELQRLHWIRDGELLTAHVSADAFCWSMVRSLVGALLAVGEGRRRPDWCRNLLSASARSSDFAVAPALGLTLESVDYPPDAELASRTFITRDIRRRE